ncbi:hypothetical protein M8J76_008388 [Diaphorina citri]|nr:hypothetical protein M8J76_008388 [Diaphorina citri]
MYTSSCSDCPDFHAPPRGDQGGSRGLGRKPPIEDSQGHKIPEQWSTSSLESTTNSAKRHCYLPPFRRAHRNESWISSIHQTGGERRKGEVRDEEMEEGREQK